MAPPDYPLYQRLPGHILAFHGCDESVGENLLCGKIKHLARSTNKYDWLGDGVYFWENDPLRAWEFANEASKKPHTTRGSITKPFVIGAVIDLGFCLNLMDRAALGDVRVVYQELKASYLESGQAMPANKGANHGARFLDRAVIEMLHALREELNDGSDVAFPAYDTVRSAFPEGRKLYAGAGFKAKNHIQIAVRNLASIKGYFRPIQS
jgi:hypothetical protein